MKNQMIIKDLEFNQDEKGEWYVTSLEIAKFTGKRHDNVLRDIHGMEESWIKLGHLKFEGTEYKSSQGKKLPCIKLSRKECLFVISKYDDMIRGKLIDRWEELEIMIKKGQVDIPSYQIENPVERAKKWIEEYNQHEAEKQVLRIENKALKEENKELKEDNQVKGDDIDNLVNTVTQLRAGLYGSKVGNVNTGILKMANNDIEMTELYYHPNYMTTGSMGQAKPGLLYTNGLLKCLANHLNWKLYAIPDYRHNRRSIIYPRAIFNLASTYQERYFDEITQGTGTYQITGQDLANFILEKMIGNNERNKFYNTTDKDLLI